MLARKIFRLRPLKRFFSDHKKPQSPKPSLFLPSNQKIFCLLGVSLGVIGYSYYSSRPTYPLISFEQLLNNYHQHGLVSRLVVRVKQESSKKKQELYDVEVLGRDLKILAILRLPNIQQFLQKFSIEKTSTSIQSKDIIPVQYRQDPNINYLYALQKITPVLANLSIFSLLMYLGVKIAMKNSQKSSLGSTTALNLFKTQKNNFKIHGIDGKKIPVKFKDVAGLKQAKKEIMEFVDFLKFPQKFKLLGAKIPRGALLVGPPGTGKTLLAKAAAGEAQVPFFSISGSDFVQKFVGLGASRVRTLFKQAKQKAPSIIFIDEIDAVGRKRHQTTGGNDQRDTTLNQLLVEIDGFGTNQNVVILGGTNRKDILDSALLRPGRFDRTIQLSLPDLQQRAQILQVHLSPLKLDQEMSVENYANRIAALSPGFSGADLANICNQAAIQAARLKKDAVDKLDFESASQRVIGGLQKSKKLKGKQKEIVAFHQAGHTVVGWFLEGADPVLKVSILPRSKGGLGFAQILPSENMLLSKEEVLDKICSILAGRVAQEVFFGSVTTGAQDDLKKATNFAYDLVNRFGMNQRIGVVGYQIDQESFFKPFGEDTDRIIDQEVRTVVKECLGKTRELILSKKGLVEALAQALIEKERVVHSDLVQMLGERPFEAKEGYKKYKEVEQISS